MGDISKHFDASAMTTIRGEQASPAAYRTARPDRFAARSRGRFKRSTDGYAERLKRCAGLRATVIGCRGDVRDAATVAKALQGVEGLYHLAGRVSRDPADARKMYELHIDGTRHLLAAAEKAFAATSPCPVLLPSI